MTTEQRVDQLVGEGASGLPRLKKKAYERELFLLQEELVKMSEWVKDAGARVVVIFEGRDAAGKGGTIKRITEHVNPRIVRARRAAQADRARATQWYFQRYVEQLPAARRGDPVRPQLVQPRRRREGARLLHAGGAPAVPAAVPRPSSGCWSTTASC